MTDKKTQHLSEAEASNLWKRAAELQAEAAQRAEAEPEDPVEAPPDEAPDSDGYALEHVRAAALEAGIGSEFVDEALGELSVTRALPVAPGGPLDRLGCRFFGQPPDNIEVSRVILAPVESVLRSMVKIFPAIPYKLVLKDQRGDPRKGGVLIFDIDGAGFTVSEGWTGAVSWADMRSVYASVRRIDGPTPSCELTVRAPVAWARGINLGIGTVLTAIGSGFTGLMGVVAGEGITNVADALGRSSLGFIAALTVFAMFVLAGGGGTAFGFRRLYHYGLGKGTKALETLVSAVALDAQGGWGFEVAAGDSPHALPAPLEDE